LRTLHGMVIKRTAVADDRTFANENEGRLAHDRGLPIESARDAQIMLEPPLGSLGKGFISACDTCWVSIQNAP
jgi:hypothetical protein